LDGLEHPRLVVAGRGKIEGEAGVAIGEPTVDVAVRVGSLPPLVPVDIGFAEKAVDHLVGIHLDGSPVAWIGCIHAGHLVQDCYESSLGCLALAPQSPPRRRSAPHRTATITSAH